MLDITQENEICSRYVNNESSTSIARSLNMQTSQICTILHRNNIEIRYKRQMTTQKFDLLIPQMEEMFKNGNKIIDIANSLNIGEKIVSTRLKKLGYVIRKEHHSKVFLMSKSEEIIRMYREGLSTVEIGKRFDTVPSNIWRVLRDNQETTNPVRINSVNDNFFAKIDNEVKSYCLGWWMSDGNTSTKGHTSKLSITDEDILIEIAKAMNYTGQIYKEKLKEERKQAYTLKISSIKLRQDLINLGCVPNKTFLLKFPNITENLLNHFVRGFLDGDGTINVYSCEKFRIYNRWTVGFVGTKDMMEGIIAIIDKEKLCIDGYYLTKKNKYNDKNTWILDIKNHHGLPFLNYLYKDATIFLKRKHQKYLDMKAHYESKGLICNPGDPDANYYYNVPKKIFVKR